MPPCIRLHAWPCGGYEYKGRSLNSSAFSGKEGQQVFADRQDIAVALVDVVMERDEAGLDLVDYVRRTLDNHCTRLVLRTGQPGCLSKQSVEREHEIDDYREKTDLSIQNCAPCSIVSQRLPRFAAPAVAPFNLAYVLRLQEPDHRRPARDDVLAVACALAKRCSGSLMHGAIQQPLKLGQLGSNRGGGAVRAVATVRPSSRRYRVSCLSPFRRRSHPVHTGHWPDSQACWLPLARGSCPRNKATPISPCCVCSRLRRAFCHPEIDQSHTAVGTQHQVGGLQVAMHDTLRMNLR